MSNLFKHLKVVHKHRKYVRKACFKMGLFWQGIVHDLSKYSITELKICKYYNGTKSPHQACREELGYSPSWNHHYHVNKHHWEYWLDNGDGGEFIPIKMPYKYVIESVCDMIGASKAYNPKDWTTDKPFNYWETHNNDQRLMHNGSKVLAKYLIWELSTSTEEKFYKWYKEHKELLEERYNKGYYDSKSLNVNDWFYRTFTYQLFG